MSQNFLSKDGSLENYSIDTYNDFLQVKQNLFHELITTVLPSSWALLKISSVNVVLFSTAEQLNEIKVKIKINIFFIICNNIYLIQ